MLHVHALLQISDGGAPFNVSRLLTVQYSLQIHTLHNIHVCLFAFFQHERSFTYILFPQRSAFYHKNCIPLLRERNLLLNLLLCLPTEKPNLNYRPKEKMDWMVGQELKIASLVFQHSIALILYQSRCVTCFSSDRMRLNANNALFLPSSTADCEGIITAEKWHTEQHFTACCTLKNTCCNPCGSNNVAKLINLAL